MPMQIKKRTTSEAPMVSSLTHRIDLNWGKVFLMGADVLHNTSCTDFHLTMLFIVVAEPPTLTIHTRHVYQVGLIEQALNGPGREFVRPTITKTPYVPIEKASKKDNAKGKILTQYTKDQPNDEAKLSSTSYLQTLVWGESLQSSRPLHAPYPWWSRCSKTAKRRF